ncbi:MAG: hypothetical protein K8T25_00630 [Planctomycetia bacterium]|nr:hypothetical protein [Planctomycetia bacterium]
MSSPSSLDTALRGLVMLGVIGGGGYWAATHTPIVEIAAQKWDNWQRGAPSRTAHEDDDRRTAGGDAPAFQPGGAPQSIPFTGAQPLPLPGAADHAAPPALGASAESSHSPEPGRFPGQQAGFEPAINYGSATSNAATSNAATLNAGPLNAASLNATHASSESLTELDARLTRLGAVYMLLERREHVSPTYRFYCKVALPGGEQTRPFERVGDEPMQVMRQVVDEVEAWKTGRLP